MVKNLLMALSLPGGRWPVPAIRGPAASAARRFAHGALWSLLGAALGRGLGVLASVLVARLLGKDLFGALGLLQSTAGMFGTVAGFGLGLASTKYLAELSGSDPARAARILALSRVVSWVSGAFFAAAMLGFAPWLAGRTLHAPHLVGELRLSSLLVLFGAINGAQLGALAGFEAFKRITQAGVWTGLASLPCQVIGGWLGGLPGTVAGVCAAQMFGCVFNGVALAGEMRAHAMPAWPGRWLSELPVLWRFNLPAVLASVIASPVLWFCQTLLAKAPGGFQALAEYAVGAQWRILAQSLPALVCAAYLPIAASLPADGVRARRRFMLAGAGLSAAGTALIAAAAWLLSPWILGAYGQQFGGAGLIFGLLLAAGVADAANAILLQTLMAADYAWLRVLSNSVYAVILLGLALWLVPAHAATGLAIAIAAAQGAHLLLQFPLAWHAVRRRPGMPAQPRGLP